MNSPIRRSILIFSTCPLPAAAPATVPSAVLLSSGSAKCGSIQPAILWIGSSGYTAGGLPFSIFPTILSPCANNLCWRSAGRSTAAICPSPGRPSPAWTRWTKRFLQPCAWPAVSRSATGSKVPTKASAAFSTRRRIRPRSAGHLP